MGSQNNGSDVNGTDLPVSQPVQPSRDIAGSIGFSDDSAGNRPSGDGEHDRSNRRIRRSDTAVPRRESVAESRRKAKAEKGLAPPDDDELRKSCPLLWDFLGKEKADDGKDVLLSEVVVSRTYGGYVVTLKYHETAEKTFCTVLKFSDVARGLEKHLASPTIVWSPFESFPFKQREQKEKSKKT